MTLTIKKVPTVLSNYQEKSENTDEDCIQNCLRSCLVSDANLPIYEFKKDPEYLNINRVKKLTDDQSQFIFLNNLLLCQWEDRMERGLFRYNVLACQSKVVLGQYGFIAQLNEGRHLKKRPTEFRIDLVLQPFDSSKFNFAKIGEEEVLFRFEQSNDSESHFYPDSPTLLNSSSPSIVAINVSPIEYGHVLLIPHVTACLPQRIDHESLLHALYFAKEAADPFFRVGYNSLGAFATVNHLHFQAYYLKMHFPVEKAPRRQIMLSESTRDRVIVSQLSKYPVQGFVFEGGCNMNELAHYVGIACTCLQSKNIPFNLLIVDAGRRIFLFPQCFAEKQARGEVSTEILETQVNPAVWEISGHLVLKRRKDYDEVTSTCIWNLLSEVSLSPDRFQQVKQLILEVAGLQLCQQPL